MPDYGHLIGDRVMLHHIKQAGVKRQHIDRASVYYRCAKRGCIARWAKRFPRCPTQTRLKASFQQWEAEGYPPL